MSEPAKKEPLLIDRIELKDSVTIRVPGSALSNINRLDGQRKPFAAMSFTRLGVAIECKGKHFVVPYASIKSIELNKAFEE